MGVCSTGAEQCGKPEVIFLAEVALPASEVRRRVSSEFSQYPSKCEKTARSITKSPAIYFDYTVELLGRLVLDRLELFGRLVLAFDTDENEPPNCP